jgi:hypothetical protein
MPSDGIKLFAVLPHAHLIGICFKNDLICII